MSASRERKKRMAEAEQTAPQQAKKTKKKLSEGWIFAIVVILIPVIVFGVIFGVQASWRNATVVSVGDHKISATEFNYFYRGALNSIYNTYGSYISLLGIDTSTPLDEQSYTSSDEYDTWADFLADSAKTSAVDAYAVYDKAVEAGFTLSDDDKASIDSEINTLNTYATLYSMDLDEYIAAMFGKGCDEESYRHFLEVSQMHDAYLESLTYTEDEINTRYEQDTTEFDTVTYYSYAVKASDFETASDSTDSTEDTTSTEPSEEAIAAAREAANAMVSDFKTDDENVSIMTERTKSEVTSSISEDAANWLYTEAKAGDTKLFELDNTFYVLQLTSINDNSYQTVNALQLYIAKDADDKEYSEGEKTSEERVSELEAALKEDSSEEKFREYITTYADNTSSYTITNGTHRSITPEVARTWLFDSSRKAGDTKEFVDDNGGTYVFFFQDFAETYRDLLVTNTLKSEWYDEVTSAAPARTAIHHAFIAAEGAGRPRRSARPMRGAATWRTDGAAAGRPRYRPARRPQDRGVPLSEIRRRAASRQQGIQRTAAASCRRCRQRPRARAGRSGA